MVTIDTNIVFYALDPRDPKTDTANTVFAQCRFLSVQILNEYTFAARRKLKRSWEDIAQDLTLLTTVVDIVAPLNASHNSDAIRLCDRYKLPFYDALIVAVGLANGATTLYSEDMQHGLIVDDRLTIINPFLETA